MVNVRDIQSAIEALPPDEFQTLLKWFWERDAALWDRQFVEDVAAGKLDSLADEAIADANAGGCTDL